MTNLARLRRQLLLQYLVTVALLLVVSETALYAVSRWAGQRELNTALKKDIERITSTMEVEPGGEVEIEGDHEWENVRLYGRASRWQILREDGSILGQSETVSEADTRLPAVGGRHLPLDRLCLANAADARGRGVRVARIRTSRRLESHEAEASDGKVGQVFDIRAVVDRTALDAQLASLAWTLIGGFPIALALASAGGHFLIRRAVLPVDAAFRRERRFAGAASHELRTPLTALRAEIDVTLRHERPAREYVQAIRRMDALVGRMTGLVEGLLIVARANAGHLLVDTAELTVSELEATVTETIAPLTGHDRVTWRSAVTGAKRIHGDVLLLAVAVRNLVENSLLCAATGGVEITCAACPGGGLEMSVADYGPGVPPELLAAFLERRPNDVLPGRRSGGAGLGLSIARAIVESHGGTLLLENRVPTGCRAVIRLPGAADYSEPLSSGTRGSKGEPSDERAAPRDALGAPTATANATDQAQGD